MAEGQETAPEYFVQGPDGALYGPATVEKLRSWVGEDRIRRDTVLVHSVTREPVAAKDLPGLFGAAAPGSEPPPVQAGAPPQMSAPPGYYAAQPPKKSPVWLILLAVVGGGCVCLVPIMAAILFPVFSQARMAAKRTATLSHLKQLATGIALYQTDYDDHFPRDMSSADALRSPLLKYHVPSTAFTSLNEGSRFLGNGKLSGKSALEVVDPQGTILMYDEKPWGSRGLASFVDGHASVVPDFSDIRGGLAHDPFKE